LVGEQGAGIARLYYDNVLPITLVVEPQDLVGHVAVCNFNNSRLSKRCVAVLLLDLVCQNFTPLMLGLIVHLNSVRNMFDTTSLNVNYIVF
jgi:hypothetical protein